MSYINIVSFNSLIGSIIGLIILIVIGFIISNKDNLLS